MIASTKIITSKKIRTSKEQQLLNQLYKMCVCTQSIFLYIEKLTDDLNLSKILTKCAMQYDEKIKAINNSLNKLGKKPTNSFWFELKGQKAYVRILASNKNPKKLCDIAQRRCFDDIVILLKLLSKHTSQQNINLELSHTILASIQNNIQQLKQI